MQSIAKSVFLASGAQVVGNVEIGENSSIWYNAVLRGDSHPIKIGKNTNVQDNAVLHVNLNQGLVIGDDVTIGHGAIVHACTVGNNVLIGMGAIVLDGAVIGDNCIIGAGALITQNKVILDGSMVYGNPAKIVRPLSEEEVLSVAESAKHYCEAADKEMSMTKGKKC